MGKQVVEAMPPLGNSVIDVDDVEGGSLGIGDVEDHGGEVGKAVVGVEFDLVGLKEHLVSVYGDLAHVGQGVFWKVGIPPVIVWEALLGGAFRVVVGMDGGDCIEPRFLDQ